MNRAKLNELEGSLLLHLDFSGLSLPQEFELVIAEAEAIRQTIHKKRTQHFLLIADFTHALFTPEVYDILARYSRLATTLTEKHAIIGLKPTSLIRSILRTYTGKEVHSFNSTKGAVEYLMRDRARKSR